jgi:18S rRNA (guanine1575-N7)-methyltransferase
MYYDAEEAGKYTGGSRVVEIQTAMAERCLELLNLPAGEAGLILDIACGSGLSSDVLAEGGHAFIGLDISQPMLAVAVERGVLEGGDVLVTDMGAGFGFRPGVFDGAISVSALQWLCYNDQKAHRSAARLERFFTSLYGALRRGARAALQVYPENPAQLELMTTVAQRCGFSGGLVVDFPNSAKAKKYYLCLIAGNGGKAAEAPVAREEGDAVGVAHEGGRARHARGRGGKKGRGGPAVHGRSWVLKKKERNRARGVEGVKADTKYTGRRRPDRLG